MTHRIQPGLSPDAILVVRDYPAAQCALARIREPDHATAVPVAERFELYLGPLELANGYLELADADEQRARFERDLVVRQGRGLQPPAIDENLLDAFAHGLPGCPGGAQHGRTTVRERGCQSVDLAVDGGCSEQK